MLVTLGGVIMNKTQKGIIFTVIATFIFGFTPIMSKMTYAMGNNGVQMAFLRHLFVIPIFLFIVIRKELSLKINKQQAKDIIFVSSASALTIVTLYSSYSYIGVGTATVLHFLYPLFVCLINFLFYKQKLNKMHILCLILSFLGVVCFIEKGQTSFIGFFLAIISSLFFAYYMVGMDHTSIREVSPYVFNFYLVSFNTIIIAIVAFFTHSFHIMPISGYLISASVAILASLIGVVLLQKGIYYLGASLAAILSTLEPFTSILFGILFLNEKLTIQIAVGCVLILISTFLLVKYQNKS